MDRQQFPKAFLLKKKAVNILAYFLPDFHYASIWLDLKHNCNHAACTILHPEIFTY